MNQKILKKAVSTALVASALSTGIYGVSFADQAVYAVEDGKQVASKTVYAFKPDSLYEVHCRVGYITDIKLKPGEAVSYSLVGDTSRWMFDQTTVGGVTHIYIKPMAEGIQTNLIVNSPTRSYRFIISEGPEEYSPIIEFTFEDEERKAMYSKSAKLSPKQKYFREIYTQNGELDGRPILKKLNRQYEAKKHGNIADDMLPTEIFDDGTRTYLKMPASNKYDLPTLYLIDENNKLTLVNYRLRDTYFVADRVFSKARLKYSAKTYVDIIGKENKPGNKEDEDYQISGRIQNAVSEAYENIKGSDDIAVKEADRHQTSLQMEKLLKKEREKQEEAAAAIAELKKQVEAERQAKEKAVSEASKAEAERRAYALQIKREQEQRKAAQMAMEAEKQALIAKAKQEQLQAEANRKIAEAERAQKEALEARKISEQAQNAVKKVSVQITPQNPITKTISAPVQAPIVKPKLEVKPVVSTQKPVLSDSKKAFNEIFNTNGKLDGQKVMQALQTKQQIQKHGEIVETNLPKNTFSMNNKTYFNMSKDYSGSLPQIYVFADNRLVPVEYDVKGTYLIVTGNIPKARLQYGENTYADITLISGGER